MKLFATALVATSCVYESHARMHDLKFDMRLFKDQNFKEQYSDEIPQLVLRPDMTEIPWIWIEVSSNSILKYTHIEKCSLIPLDIDEKPMGNEDNSAVIEDGCISHNYEDGGLDNFLWMNQNPRLKYENEARFGLPVYGVEGAASWKVECSLNACEYGTDNETSCGLRESCPYQNRYDKIFGKYPIRQSTSNGENNVTSGIVSRTYMVKFERFENEILNEDEFNRRYICDLADEMKNTYDAITGRLSIYTKLLNKKVKHRLWKLNKEMTGLREEMNC